MDEDNRNQIDGALREWRQGDCVIGEHRFLFRIDVEAPLTEEAAEAAREDVDNAEAQVHGFMVATQSCDIVRSCSKRPFIEVCPLVDTDPKKLEEIRSGRRPNYAYVPGVADRGLVADLDRVMTVEKAVVAGWVRTLGCRHDHERRRLSLALTRKRARVAFPDDFVELAQKLVRYLTTRHDKQSDKGLALRALREIRVHAAPAWGADKIELTFWFIRGKDNPVFEGRRWDEYLEAWLGLVPAGGRFVSVEGQIQTLDDLTARDYVESDPLDLDHLS